MAVEDTEPWEFEEEDKDLQTAIIEQSATVPAEIVVDENPGHGAF